MIDLNGRVLQIGAGGIGFWMAVALKRAHVDLTVYDPDTLEGGLGWSRMPKASPSTTKVSLLRGFCIAVMGDEAPKVVAERFTGAEAKEGDLVLDCSDMPVGTLRSPLSRKSVWRAVAAQGARILRVSYDGFAGTVVVAEGLPLAGAVGGGYREAPTLSLSFLAGGLGAIVVQKILEGELKDHIEFQISVNESLGLAVRSGNESPNRMTVGAD